MAIASSNAQLTKYQMTVAGKELYYKILIERRGQALSGEFLLFNGESNKRCLQQPWVISLVACTVDQERGQSNIKANGMFWLNQRRYWINGTIFYQNTGKVFTRRRTLDRDRFYFADKRAVQFGLDALELWQIDPVIVEINCHMLGTLIRLPTGVFGLEPGKLGSAPKEVGECGIEMSKGGQQALAIDFV